MSKAEPKIYIIKREVFWLDCNDEKIGETETLFDRYTPMERGIPLQSRKYVTLVPMELDNARRYAIRLARYFRLIDLPIPTEGYSVMVNYCVVDAIEYKVVSTVSSSVAVLDENGIEEEGGDFEDD